MAQTAMTHGTMTNQPLLRILDGVCAFCKAILIRKQDDFTTPEGPDTETRVAIDGAGLVPIPYNTAKPLRPLDTEHKVGCPKA